MKRKRNNLDTYEANYIYSRVFLEINKIKKFNELFITKKNNLIDEICSEIISRTNTSKDDEEALIFEIFAYKLENKETYYNSSQYEGNIKKPNNFNNKLSQKYDELIKKLVNERLIEK